MVVAKRAVDPHELLRYAARRFAPYKVPKQVVFIYWWPHNVMGRVVAAKLLRSDGEVRMLHTSRERA